MRRSLLLGMLFLAIACAHAPQNASVQVIINASDGALGRVDTVVLQRVTEADIRHDRSLLRPLTLTVFFNSFGFVEKPAIALDATRHGAPALVSPLAITNLSATPWDDGLIVEHGERVDTQSRANPRWRREVVVGTYTISDDAGNVIEQRPVVVGVLDPDVSMMDLQLTSMRTTGHYLASRVAAVSK
jgi:hypothetical protein